MDFYTITDLDQLNAKIERFKYLTCALFRNRVAFGGPAGSIHLYSINDASSPVVVSIPSIVTAINRISFSPGGKYLAVGGISSVHFIEDPLTTPSTGYSIDLKGKKPCAFRWVAEPPPKIVRTPFLLVGDETGGLWIIRHNSADLLGSVGSHILQIYPVGDSILVSAIGGVYFVSGGTSTPIRGKRPNGEFGALYAEQYNAIFLARPEGKLLISTPQGKSKAILNFMEGDMIPPLPEGILPSLSYLKICPPYLLSFGKNCAGFIIDLTSGSLKEVIVEQSEFFDFSTYNEYALIMWKGRLSLFKVCNDIEEYFSWLISKKYYGKAQKLAIEKSIKNKAILESINIEPSPEFEEFIHRMELENQPQPLQNVNRSLYDQLIDSDIPTDLMMSELEASLSLIIPEPNIIEKITKYVLAVPQSWKTWKLFVNIDSIVLKLNPNSEYSEIIKEMSFHGTSELCKIISNITEYDMDFLIANSPPIQLHNIDDSRKSQFYEQMLGNDMFYESVMKFDNVEDYVKNRTDMGNDLTKEELIELILVQEWDSQLTEMVKNIQLSFEKFLLSKENHLMPPWIQTLINKELKVVNQNPSCCDEFEHWGVKLQTNVCPICGMTIQINESPCSISTFSCNHSYHVSCLRKRYCPLCFSSHRIS